MPCPERKCGIKLRGGSDLQAVEVHILVGHPIVPGAPNHLHEGPLGRNDRVLQLLRVAGAEEDVEVQAFFAIELPRLQGSPDIISSCPGQMFPPPLFLFLVSTALAQCLTSTTADAQNYK